ncbi:MAG: helix-turn-helix transcriptional regulator [Synechococcaceae cyanobacterium]|nr:helix-turn-helix transcriptional regulator [Synechococcaceae cyanobacterium]
MEIARRAVAEHGQATVARRIGYSPSALSQVLSGKYNGDPAAILETIEAEFGASTVDCPILGSGTPLADCLDARKRAERPFVATSGESTRLYFTCPTCERRKG